MAESHLGLKRLGMVGAQLLVRENLICADQNYFTVPAAKTRSYG